LAAGVNVRVAVHLAPAARVAPQVVVLVKSAALAPVIASEVIERAMVPALAMVRVWAALAVPVFTLPKAKDVALRVTGEAPEPVNATDSARPAAVKVVAAERAPVALGVNVTVTVQLPAAAILVEQVLVFEKSAAFVPVIASVPRVSGDVPALVMVSVFVALGEPTITLPIARVVALRVTGAVPEPLSLTDSAVAPAVNVIAAERPPSAAGVKVAITAQLPPAAMLVEQVVVWVKSPGFVPVIASEPIASAAFPELAIVSV